MSYALRRCIVSVVGFFEWRAFTGARAKQPYAITMKDGSPFGAAGDWQNWRNPNTGEWSATLAIITLPSNESSHANSRPDACHASTTELRPLA
jgi:putative SOS response-associated peptidase YedK